MFFLLLSTALSGVGHYAVNFYNRRPSFFTWTRKFSLHVSFFVSTCRTGNAKMVILLKPRVSIGSISSGPHFNSTPVCTRYPVPSRYISKRAKQDTSPATLERKLNYLHSVMDKEEGESERKSSVWLPRKFRKRGVKQTEGFRSVSCLIASSSFLL